MNNDSNVASSHDNNVTNASISAVPEHANSLFNESTDNHMAVDSHEVVQMRDQQEVRSVSVPGQTDATTLAIHYADADLGDFLARPIRIAEYEWELGGSLTQDFDPWQLFFSDASIKRKVSNYKYFQGNMHVKFLINGTPFHYGLVKCGYLPLDDHAQIHNPLSILTSIHRHRKLSMLMNLDLDPVNNEPAILCLPFIYPYDMAIIADTITPVGSQGYSKLGRIYMESFTNLKAASSAPAGDVTITVMAWMSEVALSGPFPVAYSGTRDEEYKADGILSQPMSLIAGGTKMMSTVPIIGPGMGAISSVANKLSKTAELFGFSRAPQINPVGFMKRKPVSSIANTRGIDTVDKLTFDPKQGVSVDPGVLNLDGEDELIMSRFVEKPSYVTQVDWTTTDIVGKVLAYGVNHPMDLNVLAIPLTSAYMLPTSLAAAALPFEFWSGSIIYRVQVIASQYHRGRVKFTFSPDDSLVPDEFNNQYSVIIDIAEDRDVYIRIPWCNNRPYLSTINTAASETTINEFARTFDPKICNGTWQMTVLNKLVTPSAAADIKIMFYKYGGKDFEVFNPYSRARGAEAVTTAPTMNNVSPQLALPSAFSGEKEAMDLFGAPRSEQSVQVRKSIFHGEGCVSFREYLKRYMLEQRLIQDLDSGAGEYDIGFGLSLQPLYSGEVSPTWMYNSPGSPNTNKCGTTLLSYLAPMFLGHRGAFRYKFIPTTINCKITALSCDRAVTVPDSGQFLTTATQYRQGYPAHVPCGWNGTALSYGEQQGVLEVEIPYYSQQRFYTNDPGEWGGGDFLYSLGDTQIRLPFLSATVISTAAQADVFFDRWVAAGEDFNFHYYLGPTTMYYYNPV